MKLALIDNSAQHLSDAVSALKIPSSDILPIQADVANFQEMTKAAQEIDAKFGKINVLCLNAGTSQQGASTWNANMEAWQKVSLSVYRRLASPR